MHPLNDVYFDLQLTQDRPFQVTGFGENAVDWVCRVPRYPELDSKLPMEPMLRFCGGQIATACSFWARLGLRTRYIGRVGDDEPGRLTLVHRFGVLGKALPEAELIISQAELSYKSGSMDYIDYILNLDRALQIKEHYLDELNNYKQTGMSQLLIP